MNLFAQISLLIRSLEFFFHLHLLTGLITFVGVAVPLRKHLLRHRHRSASRERIPFESFNAPEVSILIPAFNEGRHVIRGIDAALASDYPNHRVVVINDGSTDITMPLLQQHYQLQEVQFDQRCVLGRAVVRRILVSRIDTRLMVIDKDHSGKADTLNVALDMILSPYVCCLDADSIIMPEALGKLISRFIDEPALVAIGGAISPSNGMVMREGQPMRQSGRIPVLLGVQIIEYLRSMTTWRTGWSYLNGLLIIGGALTAFRRDALVKVGGYSPDTRTEDLDMILMLHRYHLERDLDYFIWTVPDVICWTHAPVSLDRLRSQRIRWMVGALQCIAKHRCLAYTRKNVLLGWVSFPHFVFIEAAAPLIEFAGLLCLIAAALTGLLSIQAVVIYGLMVYAIVGLMSWCAIVMNNDFIHGYPTAGGVLRVGLIGLLEPIGYRQRDAFWRMQAWWRWSRGDRVAWR